MVPPDPNGATFISPWITVLSTSITPPGGKDLFINFSAQTSLLDLSGQGGLPGPQFTFTQELNFLRVRILVDGVPASPGFGGQAGAGLVYDGMIRSLNTTLANPILACKEVDPSGVVTCAFGPDFIGQLLNTTGVRSFNFFMRDVSPGSHVVEAQVQFVAQNFRSPNAPPNNSMLSAAIGVRTLTVEQLMLDPP
jgi:hypothetical protein